MTQTQTETATRSRRTGVKRQPASARAPGEGTASQQEPGVESPPDVSSLCDALLTSETAPKKDGEDEVPPDAQPDGDARRGERLKELRARLQRVPRLGAHVGLLEELLP